ncbi:hypothetical protein C8R46DRAFT_1205414 [Mycena filopes]|nr:hypothetical protein C8R46DRAFT_1205414 [Mycena filopes]
MSHRDSGSHPRDHPAPHTPGNQVPALWFVKAGADTSRAVDVEFFLDPLAAGWGIPSASPSPNNPKLTVLLSCFPTDLFQAQYTSLASKTVESIAKIVASLRTEWPPERTLFVQINGGGPRGRTWLPSQIASSTRLDVTQYVYPGLNVVRFTQLASLSKYTFVLHVSPRDNSHLDASLFPPPSRPAYQAAPRPPTQWTSSFHAASTQIAPPPQIWAHPATLDSPTRMNFQPAHCFDPPNERALPPLSATVVPQLSVAYEPLIVQVLTDRLSDGRTLSQALDRLHGFAGFPKDNWKDYYLDHRESLDSSVALPLHHSAAQSGSATVNKTTPKIEFGHARSTAAQSNDLSSLSSLSIGIRFGVADEFRAEYCSVFVCSSSLAVFAVPTHQGAAPQGEANIE